MKKVNFFTLNLIESVTSQEIDYAGLKEIIVNIINTHSNEYKDFRVLDLTRDRDLHYVADIFAYSENYLLLRMSCQKPSGNYLHRDYSTNIPEAVLPGISEQDEGIELYTYAFVDYTTGIAAVVNQKGAPSHRVLNYLITKYNANYCLEFVPIPNANGIDRIYKSDNSQISQVEIEVPIPNAEALEKMFGWKASEILDVQTRGLKATMKLSCIERKVLTDEEESSRKLIDCIKEGLASYRRAKIRAKSNGVKMQDYSFFEENFTYSIEIPTYCIRSGQKHYYTADELIPIYRDHLVMSYNENRELLKTISNR